MIKLQKRMPITLSIIIVGVIGCSYAQAQYPPPQGGGYGQQRPAQAPPQQGYGQAPQGYGQQQPGGFAPPAQQQQQMPQQGFGQAPGAAPVGGSSALDRSLRPQEGEDVNAIFENVVAVQRKAKIKAKKQIFNPYLSFDFSDAPYTMYGTAINYGYAVSEYWEIYANFIPSFVTNERTISKKVRELKFPNSTFQAKIVSEKAKFFGGLEVNYVPIYGKDSWGPYQIIRSDTFVNFGLGMIQYEKGNGMRTKLALGKTWFVNNWLNLRLQAGGSILEAIYDEKKEVTVIGLLEGGMVFYF